MKLTGSVYELRNAPRAWYLRVRKDLEALGWRCHQLDQCVFLLYFRFVSLREEMPGKKQLDSDSSALYGVAVLAGTTPKGVGPPNGGQTIVRVVASQTFAYETKRG